jgi:ribosomal protein S18 acetylase RimI-like enzyme
MNPPSKPPNRFNSPRRPVVAGLQTPAAPASGARRPTAPAPINRLAPNIRPQATAAPAQANRTAIQSRGALPQAGANRAPAINQGAARPASAAASRSAGYTVQAPINRGGSQQIRATIQGTPQVAGSVEIRAAGAGRAYISNLTVDEQHRRKGVAAKLIDAALNTARRQGFKAASLEARPSDNGITPQHLVAMYRRKGFKSVGKTGRGSPLMERKL